MFAVVKDFAYKKILEIFSQTRGTGLVNEDEVMREAFKSQGYDPDRFVPRTAPQVTTPPLTTPPSLSTSDPLTPNQEEGYDLANLVTPNIDLGNE